MLRRTWIILLFLLVFAVGALPASAQKSDPPQNQPPTTTEPLVLFTRYPSQEAAIGENITFPLVLRTGTEAQIVKLEAKNLPKGWTATFRGNGRIIQSAYVEPGDDTQADFRVEPPKDVTAGDYKFTVVAQGKKEVELPIQLTIKEKLPPSLSLETELPTLRGAPSTTFRYNVTLKNEGDEDLTVNLVSEAPQDIQVDFQLTGQDVTSIPLAANESKNLNVEIKPFPDLGTGSYPVKVLAQGGKAQASITLTAEVTGQPKLTVTTPDGRLSADNVYVNQTTPIKVVVQNTGSAPARNVELSATQPAGWKIEFDPKQIAEIPSGEQAEATANIQPAEQTVAGDYVVTIQAKPEDGSTDQAEFRITVLTPTMWGIAGGIVIAVAVAMVGLAVIRFGRR